MTSFKKLFWLLAMTIGLAVAQTQYPQEDIDSGKVLAELSKKAYNNAMARLEREGTKACNKDNVRVYKEWRKIPAKERIAYTNAVQCLMKKPGKMTSVFEGAKTAFDDFAVLHVLLVQYVHVSAAFLPFHRYFLHTYVEKLRECGYTGTMPYWEWGLDCENIDVSPLFDGSATSLGSNGVFIPNRTEGPVPALDLPGVPLGTGGGCVHSGPFKDHIVNMGHITDPDPTRYNPRCLVRDLNKYLCQNYASLRNTTDTLIKSKNIELFQAIVQGDTRYPEGAAAGFGVHGGGHFIVSGDPGSDFYFSPLEPAFYLHHAQIDRLYWVYQNLDWENRNGVAGTRSWSSVPLRQNATLDDVLLFHPLNKKRTLGELVDSLSGTPFCFVYE